jgi:hypothetical protein
MLITVNKVPALNRKEQILQILQTLVCMVRSASVVQHNQSVA